MKLEGILAELREHVNDHNGEARWLRGCALEPADVERMIRSAYVAAVDDWGMKLVEYATELDCPCCGDVGALADADGYFVDGQALVCGCNGIVSCDSETEPAVSVDDCDCQEEGGE